MTSFVILYLEAFCRSLQNTAQHPQNIHKSHNQLRSWRVSARDGAKSSHRTTYLFQIQVANLQKLTYLKADLRIVSSCRPRGRSTLPLVGLLFFFGFCQLKLIPSINYVHFLGVAINFFHFKLIFPTLQASPLSRKSTAV